MGTPLKRLHRKEVRKGKTPNSKRRNYFLMIKSKKFLIITSSSLLFLLLCFLNIQKIVLTSYVLEYPRKFNQNYYTFDSYLNKYFKFKRKDANDTSDVYIDPFEFEKPILQKLKVKAESLTNPTVSKQVYIGYIDDLIMDVCLVNFDEFYESIKYKNLTIDEKDLINDLVMVNADVDKKIESLKKEAKFTELYGEAEQQLKAFEFCQTETKKYLNNPVSFPNPLFNLDSVETVQMSHISYDDSFYGREKGILNRIRFLGGRNVIRPRANYIINSYFITKSFGKEIEQPYTCRTKRIGNNNESYLWGEVVLH